MSRRASALVATAVVTSLVLVAGSCGQDVSLPTDRIAFNCIDDESAQFLEFTCLIDADGSNLERGDQSVMTLFGPVVSPDGRLLATAPSTAARGLVDDYQIIDLNGELVHTIAGSGASTAPSWLPESDGLVFTSGGSIIVITFDGEQRQFNTQLGEFLWAPAVSPDGTTIAAAVEQPDGEERLVFVDRSSGSSRVVEGITDAVRPSWSPDGSAVAVSGSASGGSGEPAETEQVIAVIDRESLAVDIVFRSQDAPIFDPSRSPDGGLIAFTGDTTTTIVDRSDGATRTLDLPGWSLASGPPSWSGNGDRLVVSGSPAESAPGDRLSELLVFDVETGEGQVVTVDVEAVGTAGAAYPVWIVDSTG